VALALGLLLRLWFVLHAARIDGDSLLYGDIARNWLQHGVYGFNETAAGVLPTLIRLPGYPIFLALCFRIFGIDHYGSVLILQIFIDLWTCLLVYGLARRRLGSRAGILALFLAALCPFPASYVAVALTEPLSLWCVALAFYALDRWREAGLGFNRWLWTVGFSLAYALLLRPEQGLLAAAILPAMLWLTLRADEVTLTTKTLFRHASPVFVAALCVVLPLVPWTVRNWRTFHVLEPLAPRSASDPGELVPYGFQRWYRTWAIDYASTDDVYWNWNSTPVDIRDLPTRAFDNEQQYNRTAVLLTEYNRTTTTTPSLEQRFDALAAERIQADPVRYYLALPVARLLNMLFRPRTEYMAIPFEWWRIRQHPAKSLFAICWAAINLAYMAVGLWGWLVWRRGLFDGEPALPWATMFFVTFRCALLLTLDNSEPRYTLEFFPILCLWIAALTPSRLPEK
jgi:4-amino-4-deoxy-L-arabinose transferase-like glycosyltransferase